MDSLRASALSNTGINLVPYFLDSLREQVSVAWSAFAKTASGGDALRVMQAQPLLNSAGQEILAELASLECSASSGNSTLLSLEMLQLALMSVAQPPSAVVSGAEAASKKASSTATAAAAAAVLQVNELTRDQACALGVITLRNLELRLGTDGGSSAGAGVGALSPADAAKWFEALLGVYQPFVYVLKTALCGNASWDFSSAAVGYLSRLLYHYLQALVHLAKRQTSQKKAFMTFVKASAVELTLQTLDALKNLAKVAPAGDTDEERDGAGRDGGEDQEASARGFLVERACRLLDAAIGLQAGRDVEELASAAGQAVLAQAGGARREQEKTLGKKRGREDPAASPAAADKAPVVYGTSYYLAFYKSVAKYGQRPLEVPVSTAIAVSMGSPTGSTHSSAGGVAVLLHLYSLGSLRLALSDKLGAEKGTSMGGSSTGEGGKGEEFGGAKDVAKESERSRIKGLFAAGDAGSLLSYVSNAAISRRHIARMLGVTNAMVLHASPAVTTDTSSAEELHQTLCRVKLIEALASALQSSLPTHDSLDVHVEPFRVLTRRSVAQLHLYNNSRVTRPLAHVALELCCVHRLTSLDHRFLLESTPEIDGNSDTDGTGTGEDTASNTTSLLRKVYESLVLTNMPPVDATDEAVQDDSRALRASQQEMLLLLVHLHAELSRLDMLVHDLCSLAALGVHNPSHVDNLHRLLGSNAAQAKLTVCFASIPALQRHAVWETLASACKKHMQLAGEDAAATRAAFAGVLSLLVRPLSNAHTTTENVRGPASFSAPEPEPLHVLLEYAVSQLDADNASSANSKVKAGKKPAAESHLSAHSHAHTLVVATLRVGASALAQLSPSEVAGGAWEPLARLACSKLSTCATLLTPLAGISFTAEESDPQRLESILCACAALLALANFSAIASARLGGTADVAVSTDLHSCVANTLIIACQSYQRLGAASEAILLPVIHLFVQHAQSWSHVGPQLSGIGQLKALSGLLLRSQEVLLSSGGPNQTGLLRKHVVDAPLLGAALRVAAKAGIAKVTTLLKKKGKAQLGTDLKRSLAAEKYAAEAIAAARKGLQLCLEHLPPDLTDAAATGDVAADTETSGLVGDLVGLLALTAEHIASTANNTDETRSIGCVVSSALLRHVRACASVHTIEGPAASTLYGEKGAKALITLACASYSFTGGDNEEEAGNATVDLTCLLLDARLVALLTGSHAVGAKAAEAEITAMFNTLRSLLQAAPVGHHSLQNVRSLSCAVCTALTAVDWALASAAPFTVLVLKEMDLLLEPLLAAKSASTVHMEAYYIAADALRARDRVRLASKCGKAASTAKGKGAGAMTLPATLSVRIALSDIATREAWLYLLGSYLHSQRFQGFALDSAGCGHIASLVCDTLCGHRGGASGAQAHTRVPSMATIALVVSGLLLAAPPAQVASLCARLASAVQQQPLLSLRLSAAIVEAATLNSRHLGPESLLLAQQLLVLAPPALQHPPLRDVASPALEEQTLAFYAEASVLLRRVLGMERNASSSKRRPAKGSSTAVADAAEKGEKSLQAMQLQGQEGEDQGAVNAAWAPVVVGLVAQLSAHALVWCQLQQSSSMICQLALNTLVAAEAFLLNSTHDVLSTAAGALVVAVTQCVHMVLHLPAEVPVSMINAPIGAACRVFAALAQHKDASRQTPLLLSILLDLIGNTSYSIPKERLESLEPGMFALVDKCAGPKESKQALAPLGEGARAVHAELHEKYVREYKFKGRV